LGRSQESIEKRRAYWRARDKRPERKAAKRVQGRAFYQRHKQSESQRKREFLRNIKREAFNAYGGEFCACCGEREFSFLGLDHEKGGGNRDPRGRALSLYRKLKKEGWPPGFQVLCANCNWGKWVCGGICPHQLRRMLEALDDE
jgi:hypothetical protein